eukprot:4401313-Prymnesium_polylepis.1
MTLTRRALPPRRVTLAGRGQAGRMRHLRIGRRRCSSARSRAACPRPWGRRTPRAVLRSHAAAPRRRAGADQSTIPPLTDPPHPTAAATRIRAARARGSRRSGGDLRVGRRAVAVRRAGRRLVVRDQVDVHVPPLE